MILDCELWCMILWLKRKVKGAPCRGGVSAPLRGLRRRSSILIIIDLRIIFCYTDHIRTNEKASSESVSLNAPVVRYLSLRTTEALRRSESTEGGLPARGSSVTRGERATTISALSVPQCLSGSTLQGGHDDVQRSDLAGW